jgi:hypothetical protein
METRVTNREYTKENEEFKQACSAAGLEPTLAQASKFRRKLGLAYKFRDYLKQNPLTTVSEFLRGS